MTSTGEVICKAIAQKKIISFDYEGGRRTVEPFLLGIRKGTGKETLRAFFLKGHSNSSTGNAWRPYVINKMSNLTMEDETFTGVREQYNPNDSAMSEIFCRI